MDRFQVCRVGMAHRNRAMFHVVGDTHPTFGAAGVDGIVDALRGGDYG